MTAIHRFAERLMAFGAGLMMALVFATVFLNALRRYLTGSSLEWGEELPIYLTVYGVMFGVALAYLQDRHIRFTLVTDLIPERARRRLFAAMDAAAILVGAALAWSGVAFALRRPGMQASGLIGGARDLAEATGLAWLEGLGRMGAWRSAIAFGGVLLALAAALRLVLRLREG